MRSWKRCAAVLAVLAAAALIWPVSWGGQFGFVTTHGISMEPRFHTGDLAIVHPVSQYRVGDITAYHNRMLHTVVLHRIVAIAGERYTFKGDNNDWLDQERPTRSQLIGTLVLRIPHGGLWLHRLTSPLALGFVAFILLAAGTSATRKRRRNRRMSRHAATSRRSRSATASPVGSSTRAAAAAAVAIAAALAALAWTHPTTRLTPTRVERTQTVTLAYTTTVKPTAAYDSTTVTAPTPVFRNVTDKVTLRINYRGAPGRVRVDARLATQTGWESTIALANDRTFSASSFTASVPLNLDALDRRARAAARVTGLPASPLTVTVIPRVTDMSGHTFAPQFPLTLTPLTLTAPGDASKLSETAATPMTTFRRQAATLHLLRHDISVRTARQLTVGLVALALTAAAGLGAAARVRGGRRESDQIQRRWRELLLDVDPMPIPAGRPVVDVPAFATLARLAQRYELLVLHWQRTGVDTYLVQDDATVFRYRTGSTGEAPAAAAHTSNDACGSGATTADIRTSSRES